MSRLEGGNAFETCYFLRGTELEEMVGMVLFFCSDAAWFVPGQTFVVDGGQMIRVLGPVQNRVDAGKA